MTRSLLLLIVVSFLLLLLGAAQTKPGLPNKPTKNDKVPAKTKRVWDNEDLQRLDGEISVVGESRQEETKDVTDSGQVMPAVPRRPQNPAPPFSGMTTDGQSFSSDSLRGRTVLIQFWATWCPRCREDQEPVDEIARKFANSGLVVLAVDSGESEKTVTNYLAKSPRSCPVVFERSTNLSSVFKFSSYPTYVLIDAEGNVVAQRKGAHEESGLRSLLRKAGLSAD